MLPPPPCQCPAPRTSQACLLSGLAAFPTGTLVLPASSHSESSLFVLEPQKALEPTTLHPTLLTGAPAHSQTPMPASSRCSLSAKFNAKASKHTLVGRKMKLLRFCKRLEGLSAYCLQLTGGLHPAPLRNTKETAKVRQMNLARL